MNYRYIHTTLNFAIATVWLINGLFCKVLDMVNRHEQIVAEILGSDFSRQLILLIGFAEVGMAVWVLSGIRARLNAVLQIAVVATMNILEFSLVPELLLWGRLNILFALLFIVVIYYNEFILNRRQILQTKNALIT
ncbi:DoxX-like family protein [Pontibacter sp. BT310]|uniref:DoxX-like family protein n=1 Tax=Pontibacter populi TaxID=890055 RepID=A0ABS6X8P9_9BACT|nr:MULTISPECIES: DoxX-like family protein [Pontibacter]MBJ6117505.1 DoxX-like family protein [Pontibacter sp. BT310]MBR0569930.1 DoxX-like family protein [Microvirga sp. STS03]MBW3364358.1 DoxX-like family protein [Pontibacter populi]